MKLLTKSADDWSTGEASHTQAWLHSSAIHLHLTAWDAPNIDSRLWLSLLHQEVYALSDKATLAAVMSRLLSERSG